MKMRIIVDSGSNFSAEEIEKYDLGYIPLHIIYPDGRVVDDVPQWDESIYDDIEKGTLRTSQPTPKRIYEAFDETLRKYDYGIYLPLSSALSGTYMAASMVLSDMKTDRLKIIDSRQITIGIDVLVMRLLEEIEKGLDFCKVEDFFMDIRRRQRFYFLLETLEHLKRGGRIGRAAYVVGSMLKIVPLLVIDDDGYINVGKKVRGGAGKIIKIMRKYIEESSIGPSSHMHVGLGRPRHRDIWPFARELEERYGANIKKVRPLTGIHVGVWGVGVSYIEEG